MFSQILINCKSFKVDCSQYFTLSKQIMHHISFRSIHLQFFKLTYAQKYLASEGNKFALLQNRLSNDSSSVEDFKKLLF